MAYPFLLLIHLFGCISTLTTSQHLFQSKKSFDYSLFLYKPTPNISISNNQMLVNWYNLLFISILIFFFLLLLICFYYQRSIINCIFIRCSKTKNNHANTNEPLTILHQTPASKNSKSIYLTVPQPSYLHHSN